MENAHKISALYKERMKVEAQFCQGGKLLDTHQKVMGPIPRDPTKARRSPLHDIALLSEDTVSDFSDCKSTAIHNGLVSRGHRQSMED